MPRTPKKFEDFTPPWGDDPSTIDHDQLARLIHNLKVSEDEKTDELKTLRKENVELTDANEVFKAASDASEKTHSDDTARAVAEAVAKVEKERDQAKEALATEQKSSWSLQAQVKFPALAQREGESDEDHKRRIGRISGETFEDYLADAEDYASTIAPVQAGGDDGEPEHDDPQVNPLIRQPRTTSTGRVVDEGSSASQRDRFLEKRGSKHDFLG